jgi:hypothetical protein
MRAANDEPGNDGKEKIPASDGNQTFFLHLSP